ncbi:hypothetical protein LCGC14_0760730 [marine sediment metagenome]|uniref:Uncharacterized protein n=1 Tax=marine sediment metagenome TaxID=412755 RepID=A0A0F9T884_9ZZZZ|nr:hypothetical protein [bacterium]
MRRPHPFRVLAMDYLVQQLNTKSFAKLKIDLTKGQLVKLQADMGNMVRAFFFQNFYNLEYIDTSILHDDDSRLDQLERKKFLLNQYDLIRNIIFACWKDSNEILSFAQINTNTKLVNFNLTLHKRFISDLKN